jgi:hypothetical protein
VFKNLFPNGSVMMVCFFAGLVAANAQETSPKDLTGKWQVTRDLKNGGQDFSTLDLKQSAADVTGTFTSSGGNVATIQGGTLAGRVLTFSFLYINQHLDISGYILSDNKIELTIVSKAMNETFRAMAERKESTPVAGRQPLSPLPFLPPRLTRTPLTAGNKFSIYVHQTFGPPAVIVPAFGAGIGMLNPPSHYPREWKDGPQAFGRLYGDAVAAGTARRTAGMLTSVAFHEDPRYMPSGSSNVMFRVVHALAYTVVDRTDSGRRTIAVSNFAGAAAGGLVGMAYLPNGFNDAAHAEQRMAAQFAAVAIRNLAAEFQPQWGPIVKKLRVPKLLPEWWVPQHPQHP